MAALLLLKGLNINNMQLNDSKHKAQLSYKMLFLIKCRIYKEGKMWDQGGQPWQQWPLNQQQWMQSFQHQQDPSK